MRGGRAGNLVRILEAAYRLDCNDEDWCRSLLVALAPELDCGAGLAAMSYRARAGRLNPLRLTTHHDSINLPELFTPEVLGSFPAQFVRRSMSQPWCVMTEIPGWSALPVHLLAPKGIVDFVTIVAAEKDGEGFNVHAPVPRRSAPPRGLRARLSDLARHIGSARHIRRRLGQSQPGMGCLAAVLTTTGQLVHAETVRGDPAALDRLRAAVVALERARRKPGDDVLRAWPSAIDGRWTLIDRIESEGRRYVVAVETREAVERLTLRESEIVGLAATGLSNKEIAFDLGIAHATVKVLIHRAATRLGLTTRQDLVERYRDRSRSWEEPKCPAVEPATVARRPDRAGLRSDKPRAG
jgi:DNA-binding CsgD family transcriptional regulator